MKRKNRKYSLSPSNSQSVHYDETSISQTSNHYSPESRNFDRRDRLPDRFSSRHRSSHFDKSTPNRNQNSEQVVVPNRRLL